VHLQVVGLRFEGNLVIIIMLGIIVFIFINLIIILLLQLYCCHEDAEGALVVVST